MGVWSQRDTDKASNIQSWPATSWLVRAGFVARVHKCTYKHAFPCGLLFVWRLRGTRALKILETADTWPVGHTIDTAQYAWTTAVASTSKKPFTSEEYTRLKTNIGHIVTIFDSDRPEAGFHCAQVVCYVTSNDMPLVVLRKLLIVKVEYAYVTVRIADLDAPPQVLVWSRNIRLNHCGYCVHTAGTMALHCGDSLPVHLIEAAHITKILDYHSKQETPKS